MFLYRALVEDDVCARVDTHSEKERSRLPRLLPQQFGGIRYRERVQVNNAIETLVIALQRYPLLDRSEQIAEMKVSRRLNSGEYQLLRRRPDCRQWEPMTRRSESVLSALPAVSANSGGANARSASRRVCGVIAVRASGP